MAQFVPAPFALPREFATELAKLGPLLDVGDDVKQLGEAILVGLHGQKRNSDYRIVAYLLFTKAFKSFQAAQTLCRCGYGSDALSICGGIFENLVDLLYVGQAPVRRPSRYIQYEQVEKYQQACKVLARKRLPNGRRRIYKKYRQSLHPQVRNLLKFFPDRNSGWSQKSLFRRAKEVKAEVAYQEIYWIFCAHKHTLPMAAVGLTITHPSGRAGLTAGPDIIGVYHAAEQSCDLFLKVCRVFQDAFGLSLLSRIEKCSEDLRRTTASILASHPGLCE